MRIVEAGPIVRTYFEKFNDGNVYYTEIQFSGKGQGMEKRVTNGRQIPADLVC